MYTPPTVTSSSHRVVPKLSQSFSKVFSKLILSCLKTVKRLSRSCPQIVSKLPKSCPEVVPMLYQSCFKVVSKLSQSLKVVLKFPFTHLGTICFCPLALPSLILHYCQILPILSYIKLYETRHYVLQFRFCQSSKAMPFLHGFPVNRVV